MTDATSLRKLFVVCDSRVPTACQALATEQNILGRLVFKNQSAHRRHRHQNYLAATFKALDVLLRNVDSLELKNLAQFVVDSGKHLTPTAEPLTVLGNQESLQLLRTLEVLQSHAQSLQEITKVACAAFHPMVRLGFFVPMALCATALLGRVYALSGEICDAVSAAAVLLKPTSAEASHDVVKGAKALELMVPPALERPSDDDMGVPLTDAEVGIAVGPAVLQTEVKTAVAEVAVAVPRAELRQPEVMTTSTTGAEVGVAVPRPAVQQPEVTTAVAEVKEVTLDAPRRRRLTSFPRAWSQPRKGKQAPQRVAGRPWRRLLRIASSIIKKPRASA